MQKTYTAPMTTKNFPEAGEYMDHKRRYTKRRYAVCRAAGTSLLCGTLFLIGMGIIVSGFIFHVGSDYFASAPNLMPIMMSSAMGLLILFSLLDQLFVMLCWPLYRCKIPYALVAEAEYYQYVGSKEIADLPADELRQSCRTAAAKLREQGVMLEIRKDRASANLCFLEGSHLGDPLCMENYARHCIFTHKREAALYWLDRCIASGEAHPRVHRQRRALKWRRHVKVRYL